MKKLLTPLGRLDTYTLEMILAIGFIPLYDFLLSDGMSLPLAIQNSTLGSLRLMDRVASGLEFWVPVVAITLLLILWLTGRNKWVHPIVIAYLIWVTLRLTAKVILVLEILLSRQQRGPGVLVKDTLVLWFVNILLFGVWYWIVDGGGPRVRHDAKVQRYDVAFPQRMAALPGWEDWKSGFWDYIFLGFAGSTQFSLGDTGLLSVRVKMLFMLQVTLSIAIIVFIASVTTGAIR